ncbi:alpha/beta fold hydrolase [Niveispirillum sp.]|uniref:alpha/beta fold hydrolase n=1 Tax=Niveispirillum sp. TaxID=1917217 RepID=UPI001B402A98|nr:alpha/beta fold hydrolase [Niveispirillum sp.]MBP7338254.1 alpha/beta fold hydrolase [Niveispirillum sp.]
MSALPRPAIPVGRTRRQVITLAGGPAAWINGGRLGIGEGLQRPLVLLHGLAGDALTWQFNLAALGADRAVLAPDLPGHGSSTLEVGAGHVDDLARWVGDLIDAWGVPKVDLVGHSLGARVALSLAHQRPGVVARATLIACAGLGSDLDHEFLDRLADASDLDQSRLAAAKLFSAPGSLVEPMARALTLRQSVPANRAAIKALLDANRAELSERLVTRDWAPPVPVQLIWGADDGIVPPPPADLIPAGIAFHLLSGAGHMPHVEAASRVNALIGSFH